MRGGGGALAARGEGEGLTLASHVLWTATLHSAEGERRARMEVRRAVLATQQRDSGGGLGLLKGHSRQKRKENSAPNLGQRMQETF